MPLCSVRNGCSIILAVSIWGIRNWWRSTFDFEKYVVRSTFDFQKYVVRSTFDFGKYVVRSTFDFKESTIFLEKYVVRSTKYVFFLEST